jgi:hypothetical protein
MPQYLILVKGGQGVNLKNLATETRGTYLRTWELWLRDLRKKGILVTGAPLVSEGIAIFSSGKQEQVPENYDLASDVVAGFFVVQTGDELRAKSIADECPFLEDEFTSCEIREFKNL